MKLLGPFCNVCGEIDGLEINHRFGDGNKDRVRFGNNEMMGAWYLVHPGIARLRLEVLCGTHHNMVTYGERPTTPSE